MTHYTPSFPYLILPDEQILKAYGNSNFGPHVVTAEQKRRFLVRSLFAIAVGYHQGFSILSILRDLKLIRAPRGPEIILTKNGRLFLRPYFDELRQRGQL